MDKLAEAIEQLDDTMTPHDKAELKAWVADKIALVVVDMDTQKIIFATPGAEDMFGFMPDEMIGIELNELVPDQFKGGHGKYVEGFNAHPQPRMMGRLRGELLGKQRDGHTFPVEISLFPRKWRARRICVANLVSLTKEDKEKVL